MKKRVLQGIETKKRIIECAQKLFRERGYNDVTVNDIINESNSSKGGFYTHFKSKEELLCNMMPIVDNKYEAFLQSEVKSENSGDRISSYISHVFRTIENEIGLEFISNIYAAQIKNYEVGKLLNSTDRSYYLILKKLIEEGQAKNEIKRDQTAERLVRYFTSCIRGVIYDWCLLKGEFNLVDYGMEITGMMLKQLIEDK